MNEIVKIEILEESLPEDLLARHRSVANLSDLFIESPFQTMMIDGQWGAGKTWFARAMRDYLSRIKHSQDTRPETRANVIWLDAFAHESMDDPLLVIWQHIINELGTIDKEKMKEIVKSLLKIGINLAIELVPQASMVKNGLNQAKKITKELLTPEETFLEKKLLAIKEASEGKKKLKEILEAKAKDRPLVIFIDELDRCNPHFAVRLFERVKHYFDAENVKIIYVANKQILSGSIAGYYNTNGTEFNAKDYLEKFIDRDYHIGSFQKLGMRHKDNFIKNEVIAILGENHDKKDFFYISLFFMFDYHSVELRKIKTIIKDIIFNAEKNNNYSKLSMWFYIAKNSDNKSHLYQFMLDVYNKSNEDDFYDNFIKKINSSALSKDLSESVTKFELNSFFAEFYRICTEEPRRNLSINYSFDHIMKQNFVDEIDKLSMQQIKKHNSADLIFGAIKKVEEMI